jgi:spermidine synthase
MTIPKNKRQVHILIEGLLYDIISSVMEEGLYFAEKFTDNIVRNIKVENLFYEGKTKYQHVQIFDNKMLGKVLFLDQKIQTAAIDESVYHETLVHPALMTHPNPQDVLVIGGGEGATLREVLRHDCVKKAVMVDIDKELVHLCAKYLPEWSSGAFADPRVRVVYRDALRYVQTSRQKFDVIISDLTEPIEEGPSVPLFSMGFFKDISRILNEDGVFVLQAGSADLIYSSFFISCAMTLEQVFPIVRPYRTFLFSFSSSWGFILASKKEDPLKMGERTIGKRIRERKVKKLKFYHPGIHNSQFALPLYLEKTMKKGRIITKKKPFIWEL